MDAELEWSVHGWAGQEFTPQENSHRLSCASFSSLFPTWGHSVVGCVNVPDPKRRISAARAAHGGMNPVLDVLPAPCQGAKHLGELQAPKEPHGVIQQGQAECKQEGKKKTTTCTPKPHTKGVCLPVEENSGPSGPAWRELPHLHIRGEFMNYAATTARPEESAATRKAYLSLCLIDLFFLSCFFQA